MTPALKPDLKGRRRRAVAPATTRLATAKAMFDDGITPMVYTPEVADIDVLSWLKANIKEVREHLNKSGCVLLRGMGIDERDKFLEVSNLLSGNDLLNYENRSTPRSHVGDKIYTSTEYPKEFTIPLHNENAYTNSWPGYVYFYADICAERGGETPIADSRLIFNDIPQQIVDAFEAHGVRYVRNFGGFDLPWQEVFNTDDRKEVEAFCNDNDIQFEWFDDGRLRTSQVCQATHVHPLTGEKVWFNQAHLFHVSALEENTREAMLSSHAIDELPRNAFFGDGSEIPTEMLDTIREIYQRHLKAFLWQKGDLMIVDNVLCAHGRQPFEGQRRVLVGMSAELNC